MAIQKPPILETSTMLNTRFLEASLFQCPHRGKVAGIDIGKNPHNVSLTEIIADSLTQSLCHNPFVPIGFGNPITYFCIEAFHIRASVEANVSHGFRIYFNAIIVLHVLGLGVLYE